jgi:hypothetical protein
MGTTASLTRIITVSPNSRGLRINIDGVGVLVSRDGDDVVVTTLPGKRTTAVRATDESVAVRILP